MLVTSTTLIIGIIIADSAASEFQESLQYAMTLCSYPTPKIDQKITLDQLRENVRLPREVLSNGRHNCSSQCIFSQMQMVNNHGEPDEMLIAKRIEDTIPNKVIRIRLVQKVGSCFNKFEIPNYSDECDKVTYIYQCLKLEEINY